VSEQAFDFLTPLERLTAHGVRFVVIGGVAARLRGSNVITTDLDISYARDDQNLLRTAAALVELLATLPGAPKDIPFVLDAKTLEMGDSFTLDTKLGSIDVLGTPAGIPGGYEELERAAEEMDLGGTKVKVASLDDLIRMKRAAGRPKDLVMVEELGALRDEIDARAAEERRRRSR
jgi:predicted nucleotidyltransferase